MVGIHNLYWYYGSQTYEVFEDGDSKLVHSSEAFRGSVICLQVIRVQRRPVKYTAIGPTHNDSFRIIYVARVVVA